LIPKYIYITCFAILFFSFTPNVFLRWKGKEDKNAQK